MKSKSEIFEKARPTVGTILKLVDTQPPSSVLRPRNYIAPSASACNLQDSQLAFASSLSRWYWRASQAHWPRKTWLVHQRHCELVMLLSALDFDLRFKEPGWRENRSRLTPFRYSSRNLWWVDKRCRQQIWGRGCLMSVSKWGWTM